MRFHVLKQVLFFVHCLTFVFFYAASVQAQEPQKNTIATIKTSMGAIKLELFDRKAPKTVANFIQYAQSGYYNGTVFHRVIPDFMIQGGGFDQSFRQKATQAPIINEAKPFVPNNRGTIAMARTSDPNSATSQFFINVKNNSFLNKTGSNPGYAVFGRVIEGQDISDKISKVETGFKGNMRDVPKQTITIESVVIEAASSAEKK